MANNQHQPGFAEQRFQYGQSTNISKEMIRAGTAGKSRIRAGLTAAWKAKTSSMYGDDTTAVAKVLRLFGQDETAKWYDRFFAKETKRKRMKGGMPPSSGGVSATQNVKVAQNSAQLKVINAKLDVLGGAVSSVQEDVLDIKSLLMPKGVVATGKKGTADAGRVKFVQFNPLAPQGEQYREVTESGKLTNRKPGGAFQTSASQKAALATAQLALKIEKKDREKSELRKKNQWKDPKEIARSGDPIAMLRVDMNKNFEKVFGLFDQLMGKGGVAGSEGRGVLGTLSDLYGAMKMLSPIFSWLPKIMPFLAKVGAVGFAGWMGYELGTWLNEKFDISTKIVDGIFAIQDWIANFSFDDVKAWIAELPSKVVAFIKNPFKSREEAVAKKTEENKKAGRMPGGVSSTKGMSREESIKHYENMIKNAKTPQERESYTKVRDSLLKSGGKQVPQTTPPKGSASSTGTLQKSTTSIPTNDLYESRLAELSRVIASGESGGDYNIYNKGTIGKNKGKIGREDLSNMTIAEYLRRGSLGPDDPMKMFAVGKYQIIPSTMVKAINSLGIDPNTTYLTPETQERIFRDVLIAGKPAVKNWLMGKSDDTNAAILALSKEWASIGVPTDMTVNGRAIKAGQSYYSGIGGNVAHTAPSAVIAAMNTPSGGNVLLASAPSRGIPSSSVSGATREVSSLSSGAAQPVVISSPTTVNAPQVASTGPRMPLPKATSTTRDDSFVRVASRDVKHPTMVG